MAETSTKDQRVEALRGLAVQDLHFLLAPSLASPRPLGVLARRAQSKELRKLCNDGVIYTKRRVKRIQKARRV